MQCTYVLVVAKHLPSVPGIGAKSCACAMPANSDVMKRFFSALLPETELILTAAVLGGLGALNGIKEMQIANVLYYINVDLCIYVRIIRNFQGYFVLLTYLILLTLTDDHCKQIWCTGGRRGNFLKLNFSFSGIIIAL